MADKEQDVNIEPYDEDSATESHSSDENAKYAAMVSGGENGAPMDSPQQPSAESSMGRPYDTPDYTGGISAWSPPGDTGVAAKGGSMNETPDMTGIGAGGKLGDDSASEAGSKQPSAAGYGGN